jgi:hypothetical protein
MSGYHSVSDKTEEEMKLMKISWAVLIVLLLALPCHAALKTVGKSDKLTFDPTNFPPQMKSNWQIMKTKCLKCHTMERTVVSVTTGIAPISGQPFDKSATRAYGIKMMRKPDSNMNKQEVKACVDLMNWMLEEAAK